MSASHTSGTPAAPSAPTTTTTTSSSTTGHPHAPAAGITYARRDGRTGLELRGKEMKLSEMADFDGSSWYAQGQTAVLVNLHGPTLSKNEAYDTCLIRVRVQHARGRTPAAGGAERVVYDEMKLEALTRTDALELTSLLESAIDAVFLKDRFPRCVLVVDVVVMQDDGSLAAVALNAVMCALLDAGLPCRTTMAAVSVAAVTRHTESDSNDQNSNNITHASTSALNTAGSSLEFLLDPTQAEESLNASNEEAAGASSAVAEKGDLISTGSGHGATMSLLSRNAAQAAQDAYRCVSTGVFVFSNPACGGGLLAQLVRQRRGANATSGVSLEAYAQMMGLAERAAAVLFDFFRQCNVAE